MVEFYIQDPNQIFMILPPFLYNWYIYLRGRDSFLLGVLSYSKGCMLEVQGEEIFQNPRWVFPGQLPVY